MALYQFVCSVVVIVLSANGCYSSFGECGKLTTGEDSGVFPWQVTIGTDSAHMCLGVIISDQWVMTSINCGYGPVRGTTVTLGRPQAIQLDNAPSRDNEARPTPSTPTQPWPTPSTPTETRPTPSTPTETRPTPSTPTETRPTPSTPTETRPTPSTPTETRPTPSTPTETRPTPSTPTETRPTPSTPTQPWPTPSNTTQPWPAPTTNKTHLVEKVVCRNNTPDGHRMMSGLCLLKLLERVDFTDSISPVCLADKSNTHHSKLETYVLAGAPHPFLKKVPLVGERRCDCHYPESQGMICANRRMEPDMTYGYMPHDYMMAKKKMDGYYMDDCESGMGAMIMSVQDDTWTLLGVSTGDRICDDSEEPLFFYPVSWAQEWIEIVTGIPSYSFNTLTVYEPDPDDMFNCHECPYPPPYECRDDSIFGGANMIPASPFVLLFVLALSLSLTEW